MRDLERKRISEILKRAKAGEDDVNLKSVESLMDDAVVGVPEDAPADYDDAGAAPVLGNPNDDRLVQARGSMASPYFTDKATSESIAAGETPVQFSGRYGERVRNAGPDDLTLASPIHKVDRSDPRYRTGEPAPAETPETADSAVAEGAFDYSKQQSWGDKYGGYNYTYIPLEDSKAGIIKVEWMDGGEIKTATLDPTKPMSPKNERAYLSIMDQRLGMDKPPSVNDLRPKPPDDRVSEGPQDDRVSEGPQDDRVSEGPPEGYQAQKDAFSKRAWGAEEAKAKAPAPKAPMDQEEKESFWDRTPRRQQVASAATTLAQTVFGGPGARAVKEAQTPTPDAAEPNLGESEDPSAIDALYEEWFGQQSQ